MDYNKPVAEILDNAQNIEYLTALVKCGKGNANEQVILPLPPDAQYFYYHGLVWHGYNPRTRNYPYATDFCTKCLINIGAITEDDIPQPDKTKYRKWAKAQ